MDSDQYITDLGKHLNATIGKGALNLGDKNTINYDKLLEEIYSFTMNTVRKDGKAPGARAYALVIACKKLIEKIEKDINE